MTAAALLRSLRRRGVWLWREGDRLAVRVPPLNNTAGLRQTLALQKADLLRLLDQEAACRPVLRRRTVCRTPDGVEIVQVEPLSPPGRSRWEKRLVRGVVSLVGDATLDPAVAASWVEVLGRIPGTVTGP